MTPGEFRRCVSDQERPDLSLSSLKFAANYFIQEGWTDDTAIKKCLKFAAVLEDFRRMTLAVSRTTRPINQPPNPGQALSSGHLREIIWPAVEALRRELFGSPAPPFASLEDAIEWLVKTAEKEWNQHVSRVSKRCRERQLIYTINYDYLLEYLLQDPSENLLRHTKRETKAAFHLTYTQREIPYVTSKVELIPKYDKPLWHCLQQAFPNLFPEEGGFPWAIKLYGRSRLSKLEQVAHDIADAIGFHKRDVVAYILADVTPILPMAVMRVEKKGFHHPAQGIQLECTSAVIEIPQPQQLTYEQFMETYRWLRQTFHVARVKALTTKDQRLLNIIERVGGVPSRGKQAFWEQVRQVWNQEAPQESYSHWRGLNMKYKRLMKKVATYQPVILRSC